MRYLFHRIIRNEAGWLKPTPGRLGYSSDGKYLKANGFGHEDWNFRKDISSDGRVHGYAYYNPKNSNGRFNIAFATYDKGNGWAIAGFYRNAVYDASGGRFSASVLKRRAAELKELDGLNSLGGKFRSESVAKIEKLLKQEAENYRWHARGVDVHQFQVPFRLPLKMTKGFGAYFTTATELDEKHWNQIISYSKAGSGKSAVVNLKDENGDVEFPEGKPIQKKHWGYERNPKAVRSAKERFKERHGKLFCEVCDFDFHKKYGSAGYDYIEVHHQVPVSEMRRGQKTQLKDLSVVCSNCHRILHRRRPWLKTEALRRLIATART